MLPLRLSDMPALFTTVPDAGTLAEVDAARTALADYADLGEVGPDLAAHIRDHLDATERAILAAHPWI